MLDSPFLAMNRQSTRRRRLRRRGCAYAIALVARQKNIPEQMIIHTRRGPLPVARARQLAMYLCHVVLRRTLMDVGIAFGRDRTTVSYACALIEDMRDDRGFDEEVSELERQLEMAILREETERHAA